MKLKDIKKDQTKAFDAKIKLNYFSVEEIRFSCQVNSTLGVTDTDKSLPF